MGLLKGLTRLFFVCLVPLLLFFSFGTFIHVIDACEFPMILRLSHLIKEHVDQDPAQRAIWDREIGPRPIPLTFQEQQRQLVAAKILPSHRDQIFQQVHEEFESGGRCRSLRLDEGLEALKLLLAAILGLAAALGFIFLLIRSFTWVKDGFK